jgi:hypothetical protein
MLLSHKVLVLWQLLCCAAAAVLQPFPTLLELPQGRLRGAHRGNTTAFLGIPYAAPPLGS